MLKNKTSVVDDRGFNQGFKETATNLFRLERRADWMIDKMNINSKSTKILEIGSGTGYISYIIAKKTTAQVLGTDLCIPFIEFSKKNYQLPNLRYEVLDFNKVVVDENHTFDYIIGNGILHHLYYHLDEGLINMKKLLKPNGKIIFMEPNIYNPYILFIFKIPFLRKWAKLEPDEMAFSKSFIQKKLKNKDFSSTQVEYKDFLLPGTPHFLVKLVTMLGNILEKTPLIKNISQSILIQGGK